MYCRCKCLKTDKSNNLSTGIYIRQCHVTFFTWNKMIVVRSQHWIFSDWMCYTSFFSTDKQSCTRLMMHLILHRLMQVAIIEVSCWQPFFQEHSLESNPAILEWRITTKSEWHMISLFETGFIWKIKWYNWNTAAIVCKDSHSSRFCSWQCFNSHRKAFLMQFLLWTLGVSTYTLALFLTLYQPVTGHCSSAKEAGSEQWDSRYFSQVISESDLRWGIIV